MERKKVCLFCNQDEDNELLYGKFCELDDIVTHYYCLLLSSNMEQNGGDNDGILGFLREDILKELRRGKRLMCWYCKRSGATLGCCVSRCKKVFHLPCGRREGSLHQFFGQFKSFCAAHRPVQKIDSRILLEVSRDSTCAICYESVQPTACPSTLWAPCCRINAWFHRDCVQRLAMSAGYFFKCPLCNNKSTFQKAMLDFGIYIPEQDASWELEPNAFQELLHRHNRCDSMQCLCPKGRFHEMVGTRWELVLCRYCGSQGIHVGCGPLKFSNPEWECDECKTMLRQVQEGGDADDGNEPSPAPSAIYQAPSRQRRRHFRGFGCTRRAKSRDDELSASSTDPPCSSSQSPILSQSGSSSGSQPPSPSQSPAVPMSPSPAAAGPVSPPTPISVVEVSDEEIIEIIDDDDEPPAKKPSQDNKNMILSSDGRAIPVIQVMSIPASDNGQDFCVVGDLNVKMPGQLNAMKHAGVEQSSDVQTQSTVSQTSTSNVGGTGSGANFSTSSGEDNSSNSELRPPDYASVVTCSRQSTGLEAVSGEGYLLKSYLTSEAAQRCQVSTVAVQGLQGQIYNQPPVSASSVHANGRGPRNSSSTAASIQGSAARSVPHAPAASATSRFCDRPYRTRNDRQQGDRRVCTDIPAQRESRHSSNRVIPSDVMNRDFQFRVTGPNTLKMVFFDRYVVTFDLQLPPISRPLRKSVNKSVSAEQQNEKRSVPDSNISSQEVPPHMGPPEEHLPSPCLARPSSRRILRSSTNSEVSPGDKPGMLVKRKRSPSAHQTHKQKRSSSRTSQVDRKSAGSSETKTPSTRGRSKSMSRCSVDPLTGLRPRSPIFTRSRTEEACMKLQHINGRCRLFPCVVAPSPDVPDLSLRRIRQSASALELSQDSDAAQPEIEKASASGCEVDGESVSDLANRVVEAIQAESGVVGDSVSEHIVIDHAQLEIGNVGASKEEICMVCDPQPDCGVQTGISDSDVGREVSDSYIEDDDNVSHSELDKFEKSCSGYGIYNDSHSELGTVISCSEYGINNRLRNRLRSECGVVDACSGTGIFDVPRSSEGENSLEGTGLDISIVESFRPEEKNKEASQLPKMWRRPKPRSSEVHRLLFDRSFTPVVTRSKSRSVLRSKKRARRSPYYEYPQLTRTRPRSKNKCRNVSRSSPSKHNSRRDIFVKTKMIQKIVERYDEIVPRRKEICRSKSVALIPVARKSYRNVDRCGGESSRKQRSRSYSWSISTRQSSFITKTNSSLDLVNECEDNLPTPSHSHITVENVAKLVDNATSSTSEVTETSNNIMAEKHHDSGNAEKQMYCNYMTAGVNQISLSRKILDCQSLNELKDLCMSDVVRMKAKALSARKFRPTSRAEDLQRKMMKELKSLYIAPS